MALGRCSIGLKPCSTHRMLSRGTTLTSVLSQVLVLLRPALSCLGVGASQNIRPAVATKGTCMVKDSANLDMLRSFAFLIVLTVNILTSGFLIDQARPLPLR